MLAVEERSVARKPRAFDPSVVPKNNNTLVKLLLQHYMKPWGTLYFLLAGVAALVYLYFHLESRTEMLQVAAIGLYCCPLWLGTEYLFHGIVLHDVLPDQHIRHNKRPSQEKYIFTPTIFSFVFQFALYLFHRHMVGLSA